MDADNVHKLLKNLGDSVENISESLKDELLTKVLSEQLEELLKEGELTNKRAIFELEQAKLLNIYAYLLVSMQFTQLKLNGSKFDNQAPVMQEIKRVKEFMDKVKRAEDVFYRRETAEEKKEKVSQEFVKNYISATGQAPAVSRKHFEESGTHVRFNDEDIKKVASQKSKVSKEHQNDKRKKSGKIQQKSGTKVAKDSRRPVQKSKKN
jgi:DNA-binding Lrp family transcriptional regulator